MSAAAYGRELRGVGLNLLVADIATSVQFASEICGAKVIYQDPDFAALEIGGQPLLLHADHTYDDHPYSASVSDVEIRGSGVEIRIYEGMHPDDAESRARAAGYAVLDGSSDKPHGLREVYLLDPDGYCWVVSAPV